MNSNLLKDDYNAVGFYIIQEPDTKRTYVGSTVHLGVRLTQHEKLLREGKHFNPILQRTYDKHKTLDFIGTVVDEPGLSREENRKIALELEQSIIDEFKDTPLLLNIVKDVLAPGLGREQSVEEKQKRNESIKKYWETVSAEERQKIGDKLGAGSKKKWDSLTSEERAIRSKDMAEKRTGITHTNEARLNMSLAQQKRFKEKPYTEEERQKNSQAQLKYYQDHPEACKQNSLRLKEIYKNPEIREKHAAILKEYNKNNPDSQKKASAAGAKACSRPCEINGVRYNSALEASRILGIPKSTMDSHIKDSRFENYKYIDKE